MTNFNNSILKKALIDQSVSQDAYVRKWFSLHREMSFIEVEAILWNLAGGKQGNFKSPDKNTHIFSEEINFGEFIALIHECVEKKYHNKIPKAHPIFELLEGFKTLFVESAQLKSSFQTAVDFPVFEENYFGKKVSRIIQKIPVTKEMVQTQIHTVSGHDEKEFVSNIFEYFSKRVDEILGNYITNTLGYDLEQSKNPNEESFYLYAYELFLREEYMYAIDILKKGLEYFPKSVFLMRQIADFYKKTEEFEASEDYLLKALEYDPNNFEGLLEICELYFVQLAGLTGEDKINFLYYIGKYALRGHLKYKASTEFCEILGYWYKEKNDLKKACEFFLQGDFEDPNVLKNIAQISLEIQNDQQAVDFAIISLKKDVYDTDLWEILRTVALQKGIPILEKIDSIIEKILQNPPDYEEDEYIEYNNHMFQADVYGILMGDPQDFEEVLDTKSSSYIVDVISGIFLNYGFGNTKRLQSFVRK